MAFVFTYNSTTQAVIDIAQRTDDEFKSYIPMFFTLATTSLCQRFKILGLRQTYEGFLTPDQYQFVKPSNLWASNISFSILTKDPLTADPTNYNTSVLLPQRSIEYLDMYWPNKAEVGVPKYYAVDADYNYYSVVPTPDQAYPYKASFYARIPTIDEANQTNFFTITIPNGFLYETLVHAGMFYGDERLQKWEQLRNEAVQGITVQDLGLKEDGYSKRES